jgi:hypothetical protein
MPDTHTTPSLLRQCMADPALYRQAREEARREAPLRWPRLFDPDLVERMTPTVWLDTAEDAEPVEPVKRRKRKPTVASVIRQMQRAGVEIAGVEINPRDGSIIVRTGKPVGGIDTDATSPDPRWN